MAGISAPTDLLAQDTSYTSDTSGDTLTSDRSANGAKIWIENGQVKYDVSTLSGSFNTAVHHLGVGEHIDDSFTYAIRLANGTLSWNTVQVQWNGTNDAVQIGSTGTTGAISEQASATGSSTPDTTTGTVGFSDNDTSDTHTVTVVGSPTVTCSGGGVSADTMTALANALSIASTTDSTGTNQGSFAWNFNAADKTFDFLAQGETLTVTYNVQVDDHHGGAATTPVTITITGVNDPATITGVASGSVTDGGTLTASGKLTVSDPDDGQSQAIAANGPTADGSYTVDANGNWSYTATEAAIQHLGAGVTATDSFTVTSLDGTASQPVTITIHGVNDAATISGVSAGNVTDGGQLTASGTLTVIDPDDGESHAQVVTNGSATDGSYTVDASGNWSYTANEAAIQHLGAGVTTTDSFTVTSLDGTATTPVTITIIGSNDPATISGTTSGTVVEAAAGNPGTPTVSSTLAVIDPDTGQNSFQAVATTSTASGYGSYAMTTGGTWTYTLDNANPTVDALNNGQPLSDSFTVNSQDGTPQTINITINGTTDDLGGPTGIALNLNPQAGDSLANLGTFVATGDPDPGDTFTYSVGAGSSSGFVVTGGVLDVTGVAAGNSTLNLVATDSANNSLTPQTYNVWIGTSHTDSKTFAIGSSNNIGTAQGGGDTVYGSNGTDYILGGSGNDTIQGNGGADFLVGGNGSDIFLYAAQSDSTLTTPDTILDFTTHSSTADEIDFKNALGLTTISTADFGAATTLAAHTVGWHSDGTNTAVYANLGGSSESITGGADMMKIVLSGVTDLGGGNIHIHA